MPYCYADNVSILKAISDETRLKIIDMLSCGELCACDILEAFDITQPTLSYHMKILTKCGIVVGNREGAWTNYFLNKGKSDQIIEFLSLLTSDKEDCICKAVNRNKNKDCKNNKKRGNNNE